MSLLWTLVLFTHIAAATFWVGGQLMLVFVMMPVMRRTARPELLGEMATLSGRRFAKVSNFGLFPVLVLTGILMAWHDGVRLHTIVPPPSGTCSKSRSSWSPWSLVLRAATVSLHGVSRDAAYGAWP